MTSRLVINLLTMLIFLFSLRLWELFNPLGTINLPPLPFLNLSFANPSPNHTLSPLWSLYHSHHYNLNFAYIFIISSPNLLFPCMLVACPHTYQSTLICFSPYTPQLNLKTNMLLYSFCPFTFLTIVLLFPKSFPCPFLLALLDSSFSCFLPLFSFFSL